MYFQKPPYIDIHGLALSPIGIVIVEIALINQGLTQRLLLTIQYSIPPCKNVRIEHIYIFIIFLY